VLWSIPDFRELPEGKAEDGNAVYQAVAALTPQLLHSAKEGVVVSSDTYKQFLAALQKVPEFGSSFARRQGDTMEFLDGIASHLLKLRSGTVGRASAALQCSVAVVRKCLTCDAKKVVTRVQRSLWLSPPAAAEELKKSRLPVVELLSCAQVSHVVDAENLRGYTCDNCGLRVTEETLCFHQFSRFLLLHLQRQKTVGGRSVKDTTSVSVPPRLRIGGSRFELQVVALHRGA